MTLEFIVKALTDDNGIFAAFLVVVSLIVALLSIVKPWIKQRRDAKEERPNLIISHPQVIPPPPWSETGEVSFELMNTQGGKALLTKLMLMVLESGYSETLKMVRPGAPVPQYSYKVKLTPNKKEYDVRQKKFGTTSPPQSFEKEEVESFLIELVSTESQWYKFQFIVEWYDLAHPSEIKVLKSPELIIDFPPEVKDIVSRLKTSDRI